MNRFSYVATMVNSIAFRACIHLRALPLPSKIQTAVEETIPTTTQQARKRRAVAYWLLTGVFMLVIQVLLGGITRLTGSGLSITEWKPLLGAIPPLNEAQWNEAFQKYQQIAQFKYLNSHFTLSDFKFIYFWEWFHREWARLIGIVFIIGFAWFLIRRCFDKEMILPFVVLFVLGALQGAIGWIMVASGLNETDLYVSHIRLAVHFMAAMVLVCYTLWFALQLLIPKERLVVHPGLKRFTVVTTLLLCVQLVYGAFMAGLKAAMAAPTWPRINGEWMPSNTATYGNRRFAGASLLSDHPLMVHFIHRTLAYVLLAVLAVWFLRAAKVAREAAENNALSGTRHWPLLLVLVQVVLGIFTVISAPAMRLGTFGRFEILAELHQLVAMFLLLALVANLYVVRSFRPLR